MYPFFYIVFILAVCRWFAQYSSVDFARSGTPAAQTVELEAGPLQEFSHAIEPQLRKLGLPTKLQKGRRWSNHRKVHLVH